jgi:hypothetical protein
VAAFVVTAAGQNRLFRRVAAPVSSAVQVVGPKEEAILATRDATAVSVAAEHDPAELRAQRPMLESQGPRDVTDQTLNTASLYDFTDRVGSIFGVRSAHVGLGVGTGLGFDHCDSGDLAVALRALADRFRNLDCLVARVLPGSVAFSAQRHGDFRSEPIERASGPSKPVNSYAATERISHALELRTLLGASMSTCATRSKTRSPTASR